jgi:hypothetical protein
MAWPSDKASNSHTDNNSDNLTSARAEIKKNIDNVNDIISEFDLSGAEQGDLIQYNASAGKWQPVTVSEAGLASQKMAVLRVDSDNVCDIVSDNDSIVSVDSAGQTFTITEAGEYFVEYVAELVYTGVPVQDVDAWVGVNALQVTNSRKHFGAKTKFVSVSSTEQISDFVPPDANGNDVDGYPFFIKVVKYV